MSAFGEWMCSNTLSQEANMIAKAAYQVTKEGKALSEACLKFDVCEKEVVRFIIEKTEYETINNSKEEAEKKRTDTIQIERIENEQVEYNEGRGNFFIEFTDNTSIQYESRCELYSREKKTLWIHANPEEVDIGLFYNGFEMGYNSENETGVWLTVEKDKVVYDKNIFAEYPFNQEPNWSIGRIKWKK